MFPFFHFFKKKYLAIAFLFINFAGVYDCFSQGVNWEWASHGGGKEFDAGNDIIKDDAGNFYVTGFFGAAATYDNLGLGTNSVVDIFVGKLNPNGHWAWVAGARGGGSDQGLSITTDNVGNLYVVGQFVNFATFGSISLTGYGSEDIFIAKIDTSGNWIWAIKAGGDGIDIGNSILFNSDGYLYITGSFRSNTATLGHDILSNNGSENIFTAKLDTSGNWIWAKGFGGSGADKGVSLAHDMQGKIYVAGYFTSSTISFSNYNISNNGGYDAFVGKIDTSGNWIWVNRGGGITFNDGTFLEDITYDNSESIYLTGSFYGTTNFGGNSLSTTSNTDYDIYVSKIDSSGNWIWAKQAGGTSTDMGKGISFDGQGSCFLTGTFVSSATFGSNYISSGSSDYHAYVSKINSQGNWIYAQAISSYSVVHGNSVVAISEHSCSLTGYYQNSVGFGGTSFSSFELSRDLFVAKLFETCSSNAQVNPHDANCFGENSGSVEVSVTGSPGTYFTDWGNLNPDSLYAGTYSVINTNGGGCSDTSTFTINEPEEIISFESYVICDGDSILIHNEWESIQGQYVFRYFSESGCDSMATIELLIDQPVQVSIEGTSIVYPFEETTYYINQHVGYNTTWNIVGGTIVSGQGTDTVHIVWNETSGELSVTVENGICITENTIQVNPIITDVAQSSLSDIQVYPNPTASEITVIGYRPAYLKLCTMLGQTVAEARKSNKLYVGNLSQGMYVLQLFDKNGQSVKTEKVIVAK